MKKGRATNRKVAYLFGEGGPTDPTVLGGKGAGLTGLARESVPVPPGFTVTTTVARAFMEHERVPNRVAGQLVRGIQAIERATGKRFGSNTNPLLVSVRSGAAVSMPGMMDTILNLGLNLDNIEALAKVAGKRFAWDSYRRFLAMFGEIVLGMPREMFEQLMKLTVNHVGAKDETKLDGDMLELVALGFIDMINEKPGRWVPYEPMAQLEMALIAVLKSWDNPRAKTYRKANGIPENMGTAITVQSMVFGNMGDDSGTGVVFSRNVATGEAGLWGEFLVNAQGEDVVAGIRTPVKIASMAAWNPTLYAELDRIVRNLEISRGDVVDVEFTVECGRLWILQVRTAKCTPEAAAMIAVHKVWDGEWTKEAALSHVTEEQRTALKTTQGFDPASAAAARLLGKGMPASQGIAVGCVALTSADAVCLAARGFKVILFRPDTSPDDLPGMLAAEAVVTSTGGMTSHAAVVARGLGKPAVVGATGLRLEERSIVSVDAYTGEVMSGKVKQVVVVAKKEVNIFLRWNTAAPKKITQARLVWEYYEESVDVNQLLFDFYLTDAMAEAARGSVLSMRASQLRNDVHHAAAERIATYLVAAVTGELRHASRNEEMPELKALSDKYMLAFGGDRSTAQKQMVALLRRMSKEEQIEFLRLAAVVFDNGTWGGSMGGPKWGAIARAAYEFLTGKLNHSVFTDHAFDLQHNRGSVFGKNNMLTGYRDRIHQQLEAKKYASGVKDLFQKLGFKISGCDCGNCKPPIQCSPSAEVKKLYERGLAMGIWKQ